MLFSKRIALTYGFLVIIPLSVILMSLLEFSLQRQVSHKKRECLVEVQANASEIKNKIDTINSLDKIIRSDNSFVIFLLNPANHEEEEIISIIKQKTLLIEQVQEVTPAIYGLRIFSSSSLVPERWPVLLNEYRMRKVQLDRWEYNYEADFLGNQKAMQLPSFCTTRSLTKNKRHVGFIQISIKMTDMFPSIYAENNTDSYEYLLKRSYSSGEFELFTDEVLDKTIPALKQKEIDFIKNKIGNEEENFGYSSFGCWNKTLAWQYIEDLDAYLIHINYGKIFLKELMTFVCGCLGILAFVIVLLFFFVKRITHTTMDGIYKLIDGMKKLKEGDFKVQIPVSGHDDVSETQETFNSLVKRLANQIELIKKEQGLIADTEMKAMQNQINAHFLYNVLETIRMQAVLADQDEIEESLQVLGKMMRYCLRWRIHRVTLAQEIEYIRSYIYILNIRNDYKISLEIDIPEEYMDIEIPKMTLQPLVENAFVHAIEKEEKDASLRVFSELSEDKEKYFLSVQDFGCGMTEEQVKKIQDYLKDEAIERDSQGSIGLKNIQQRLSVFYGSDYKVVVHSEVGKGTTITVPVPLKRVV